MMVKPCVGRRCELKSETNNVKRAFSEGKNAKRFKKILVVDLSKGDRFVAEETPATTMEAIRQAELLAKTNSAEILLYYVLPTSAEQLSYDRQVLMALGEKYKSVYEHASEVLSEVADRLTKQGMKASSKVVFGKSWVEIIGEVIRSDHDIVIAGIQGLGHSV